MIRFKHILLLVMLLCFASDCSVYKRRYTKGYYLRGLSFVSVQKNDSQTKIRMRALNAITSKRNFTGAGSLREEQAVQTIDRSRKRETVCDTLYLAGGVRMIVKVTKIYRNKTYYLLCNSDNEAEFEIETVKLKRVVYANGKTDSLKKLEEDPYDYYHPGGRGRPSYNSRSSELDSAESDVDLALGLVLTGIFFFPLMVAGFIIANRSRRKLEGKPGYERAYKKAQIISGIGLGCLSIVVLAISIAILVTLLI